MPVPAGDTLDRARRGDLVAFDQLMREHEARVFSGRHRDEPRARQRLEEIAASESDPKLRALAAALLRMPAAPGK